MDTCGMRQSGPSASCPGPAQPHATPRLPPSRCRRPARCRTATSMSCSQWRIGQVPGVHWPIACRDSASELHATSRACNDTARQCLRRPAITIHNACNSLQRDPPATQQWWRGCLHGLSALAIAVSVCTGPAAWASEAAGVSVSADSPVYDGVKLIATEKREELSKELTEFEERTGWRVRVFTSYGADARPSDTQLRAAWKPDTRTAVVNFDPSNPSLTNFVYLGDNVLAKLRRSWWAELQARYGSIFYVREEGEQAAVLSTIAAMTQCLAAPEGCRVVPGLTADQYGVCLVVSLCGGVIAGSASRLEPSRGVTSRWIWVLIFSPLWGSLFFSFGLGPIISRTSDITPVLLNTAAFLAAAASPWILYALRDKGSGGDSGQSSSSSTPPL